MPSIKIILHCENSITEVFMTQSKITSKEKYNEAYELSKNQPDKYWNDVASTYSWQKPWDSVLSGDFVNANVKWFNGAKLNITENCLDRHLDRIGNKTAIIWEPNSPDEDYEVLTYNDLAQKVNQMANVLKAHGVKKGDRVIIYMSMVPELIMSLLACARIGAVHSVVFAGFSAQALSDRINDCGTKIILTNDESFRGAKTVALKAICDDAIKTSPSIKKTLIVQRTFNKDISYGANDIIINDQIKGASTHCEAEPMDAEDPLFILYTSGSTGKPKGLVHTIGGYMVWAGETFKNVFQIKSNDLFWCTADIGWITGHSYICYGPLLNGASQVMFEGIPTYPDAGRFWQVIDKHKVTHFYTAPTAIRSLMSNSENLYQNYKLNSLKVLGTVGEPINEEAWLWYNENIGKGKCPIVDTWWQTETGGVMISNMASVTEAKPCHATKPMPGVFPILLDEKGHEVSGNPAEGNLCISRPWPGMARTIYGDHARYIQTYFSTYPGRYFTGDGARRDEDGDFRITGRVDDVINVSGHRIGTAEIEDAIDESEHIVEAAVVGYPHDIKGQGIMAYVTLFKSESHTNAQLLKEINEIITKMIGPIAKVDKLIIAKELPKTRSGKIMRRILRKIATNELDSLGDTSTLLNPDVVKDLINNVYGDKKEENEKVSKNKNATQKTSKRAA